MLNKVLNTIETYKMIAPNDHIVLGLSGGADSVALFHILKDISNLYNLSITCVHINHGIRKEAFKDASFVENLCYSNNIPLISFNKDIKALSKEFKLTEEETGRKERYKSFNLVLEEKSANKIAIAHNMNDNAETLIMRFIRGTGLKGLAGIKAINKNIIRPLIFCNREEIEAYLLENNINYIIDQTNLLPIYNRNKVRLEIIPYIETNFNNNIIETLNRSSKIFTEEENFFEEITEKAFEKILYAKKENEIVLKIPEINNIHIALKKRVLRKAISKISDSAYNFELKHINDIINLLEKGTGKALNLPMGVSAQISYDFLKLYKNYSFSGFSEDVILDKVIFIKELKKYFLVSSKNLKNLENNLCTKICCYGKISKGLKLRNRKPGDYIFIKSVGGTKKINKYLSDNKVDKLERDKVPLLALGNDIIYIFDSKNIVSDNYKPEDSNSLYIYTWEEKENV